MTCIIIDDEPLARKGIELMLSEMPQLSLSGSFKNALTASKFLKSNSVDLIFLDIKMPEISGIEFARMIPQHTLVIFVTAYSEFAVESYAVEAVDYLVKPVDEKRFQKAVEKAAVYHAMLESYSKSDTANIIGDYIFVRAERRFVKINFSDIYFVEALKDYVIIHTAGQRVITRMNLKTIQEQLPATLFVRISKSYIINIRHISTFDNNSIRIGANEIMIGESYRSRFFDDFVAKNLLNSNK